MLGGAQAAVNSDPEFLDQFSITAAVAYVGPRCVRLVLCEE